MSACATFASAIDDVALGAPPSRALTDHLATCAACATQLEQRRALAQRIDRALASRFAAEPAAGFTQRVTARAAQLRPQRRLPLWPSVGAGIAVALAAGVLLFISAFGGQRSSTSTDTVAALSTWRSPTASLLVSRSSVFGTFSVTTDRRSFL